MNRYGIRPGQIYLAASGAKHGHIVVSIADLETKENVLVWPFTQEKVDPPEDKRPIYAFKLARVRYYLPAGDLPDWVPDDAIQLAYLLSPGESAA